MSDASRTPVYLPCFPCLKCGHEHPLTRMMNCQQTAGYLGLSVQTVYKYKSCGFLPDTIKGRKNPFWIPCDLAVYLYGEKVA